jgi:hypothetical protein
MLILLVGNIGCGKTTAANILVNHFNFVEYTFASPLKEFALSIGFKKQDVYGTQEEKNTVNQEFGISGRQFMQRFGTDIMRENSQLLFGDYVENIWVKAMELKIKASENKNIVVSDGRFLVEAKLIKDMGGVIVRLRRGESFFASNHASEIELNNIVADVEYCNDGSMEDMEKFFKNLISR